MNNSTAFGLYVRISLRPLAEGPAVVSVLGFSSSVTLVMDGSHLHVEGPPQGSGAFAHPTWPRAQVPGCSPSPPLLTPGRPRLQLRTSPGCLHLHTSRPAPVVTGCELLTDWAFTGQTLSDVLKTPTLCQAVYWAKATEKEEMS